MKYLLSAFLLLISLVAGVAWTYAYSGVEPVSTAPSKLDMLDAFAGHVNPGDTVHID